MEARSTPSSSRPKPRNQAERRAARWYRLRAYRILDTNAWLAGGELDVVARRGGTLVFCEVKSKAGEGFGDPLEMVNPTKVARIRRAAEAWLARHPEHAELKVRFDVIAERRGRLQCVRSAF
jgi:putative endonuclease